MELVFSLNQNSPYLSSSSDYQRQMPRTQCQKPSGHDSPSQPQDMNWEIAFSAKENRGKLSIANQVQQTQYVANKATTVTE